jgi:hypothetical protein
MIIRRYLYGLRGILVQLAFLSGLGCIGGAIFFFQRFQSHTYLSVALVSFCVGLVVLVGVVWVFSIFYWSRTSQLEEEYWNRIGRDSRILEKNY